MELSINNCTHRAIVEYNHTPAVKGYLSGAPEDCYPSEDDQIEVTSVQIGKEFLPVSLFPAIHDQVEAVALGNRA